MSAGLIDFGFCAVLVIFQPYHDYGKRFAPEYEQAFLINCDE
jgi:hypothetical protein